MNLELRTKPEKTIVILSPCRSGSTALLNAFAIGGWQSIYQPIKGALRRTLAGDDSPVVIDAVSPCVIIKETLGPYLPAEVNYDPLGVLMQKGISPRSLNVVALMRKPEECLASWMRSFKEGVDLSLFGAAYTTTLESCFTAQRRGANVVPVRYEELTSSDVLPAMMAQLGLPFREEMVDWTKSRNYRAGDFAFEYVSQPQFDDRHALDGGRGTGLAPRIPSSHQEATIPNSLARLANITAARDVYEHDLDILSSGAKSQPLYQERLNIA
jgi:hypothetical protein